MGRENICASIYFRFYYRTIVGRTHREKFEEFLTEKEITVFSFQRSSATEFLLKGVKNMKKSKIFALFLSAVLCCGVLGFWAGCSKDYETEPFEDGVKIIKASDSIRNKESLVLPAKIKDKKVLAIGDKVFWQAKVQRVTFPEYLLEIGEGAFAESRVLEECTFNERLEIIGKYAFAGCDYLGAAADFLSLPPSLRIVDDQAFMHCPRLNVEGSRVKGMEYLGMQAFAYSDLYSSFYFTLRVEEIGLLAFTGSRLRSVVLNGVKKTDKSIFADCHELQAVEFKESVPELGDTLFRNCFQLKPGSIVAPVESLYRLGVLSGYPLMIETHIPEGTETIPESAFARCLLLSDVDIPSSVKSIGKSAFFNCFALKEIVIPATVETIGSSALGNCENLQTVRVEGNPRLEGTLFNHDSDFVVTTTVECRKDTFVEAYCKEYSVPYQLIP